MKFFDSHCHLTWAKSEDPAEQWLKRARKQGVTNFLCVGVDLASSQECLALSKKFPGVHASVGIHPNDLSEGKDLEASLLTLTEISQNPGWVAIGETGMDFYREWTTPKAQEIGFLHHLELANTLELPIIIHCREAAKETLQAIKKASKVPRGVMHCWSGTPKELEPFLELGLHASFAGNLTYPKSEAIRDSAAQVPIKQLLIETDAPFLAPQPKRGKKNEPSYLPHTFDTLANIRNESKEELANAIRQNAQELFEVELID